MDEFKYKATVGIAGNANSSAGLQPLIDIETPFNLKEDPYFNESLGGDFIIELQHTADFISMRYIARPSTVHSLEANRPGQFWIALTIPRGKRFADGVSPYTVLMDILDTFRRNYMTRRSDGSYEFNPGTYLRAPIDYLIETRYPLEDAPGRYILMSGSRLGVVCPRDETEMTQFFLDTQYDEFSVFSLVFVTLNQTSSGVLRLEIPRPVNFEVCYSGKPIGVLHSPDERFEYTFLAPDEIHEGATVSFTLSELRKGSQQSLAKVNEHVERIDIYPSFPDKVFKVDFEFRPVSGELSDIPVTPDEFFLATPSGVMRKSFMYDSEKVYAEFRGTEANEKWDVRFNGDQNEKKFRFTATAILPKEERTVVVSIAPFAGFQGVDFSGSRFVKKDTYLEVEYSNGCISKIPVNKDIHVPIKGRSESDIKDVRLVADGYRYPTLKRAYDSVFGWLKVALESSPTLCEVKQPDSVMMQAAESSGQLEIVNKSNKRLEVECVRAEFSDGMVIEKRKQILHRHSRSPENKNILPIPAEVKLELETVRLSGVRDDENGEEFKDIVFRLSPLNKGEECLEKTDSKGVYLSVIKTLDEPSFLEQIKEWFMGKSLRNWLFLLGLLLALCVGIGSSLAWQKYVSTKPETVRTEQPAKKRGIFGKRSKDGKNSENSEKDKNLKDANQDTGDKNPKDESQDVKGDGGAEAQAQDQAQDQATDKTDGNPGPQGSQYQPVQQPVSYKMGDADKGKTDLYYELMTKLEDKDGNPLTFTQVNDIDTWQKGIARQAGKTDLGDKFKFIKQYIGKYVQAAIEVENIKKGTYRGLSWTVEDYYNDESRVLPKINNACRGENLKEFRVAIQNLYIIGDDDLKNQKKMDFISRAVLSNAPGDKAILANVDSFMGIRKAFNSQ